MAEEKKEKEVKEEESSQQAPKKSGGILKLIIFGVIGILVVTGIAFGALMFLQEPAKSDAEDSATHEPHEKENSKESSGHDKKHKSEDRHHAEAAEQSDYEDAGFEMMNPTDEMMEEIMANLAVLDIDPNEGIFDSDFAMSPEDSIKEMNWLDKEKHRLKNWEDSLAIVEKDLKKLNQSVSQKLIRIEQVESARTSTLAKLYNGMDSKAVARLMANLDDNTIVSILPRMKMSKASQVLSLFSPKRAANLSKKMITIAVN